MYPISKYKFYTTSNNTTIAVSSYAGKKVKGIAKLNPVDNYNAEFGRRLAAARCDVKVAEKRAKRAKEKLNLARGNFSRAERHLIDMIVYSEEAVEALNESLENLKKLEEM